MFCLQQGTEFALLVALPPTLPVSTRLQIFVEIFKDEHFCAELNEKLDKHLNLRFTSTGFLQAYRDSKFYETARKNKDELVELFNSTGYTISYSSHLSQFTIGKKTGKYCLITNSSAIFNHFTHSLILGAMKRKTSSPSPSCGAIKRKKITETPSPAPAPSSVKKASK